MYLGWGVLKPAKFTQWFLSVGVTFRVKTRQTGLAAVWHEICLLNEFQLAHTASNAFLSPA
jgi:hypothetical protein